MTDKEIDGLLQSAAPKVDPALLSNIERSIRETLVPVRPLPSAIALTAGLAGLSLVIPAIGASFLGFEGIEQLTAARIAQIFPVLAALTILGARLAVAEMIPGSRRIANSGALLGASVLTMLSGFGFMFHDYDMSRFVPQGLVCLAIGLVVALPTALAGWMLLRRGFAVQPISAGLAAGTLAGLAGVTVLELHCPNFRAMHLLVWHTAVVPISAYAGALTGHYIRRR
jgi:hypothetical protein